MSDLGVLHPFLNKQIKRFQLSMDAIQPDQLEKWQRFIQKISDIFSDQEQDHYLLERSMQISSNEFMELNQKLQDAQEIAHIGYWIRYAGSEKLVWSRQTYPLLGFDINKGEPSFTEVMSRIHPKDKAKIAGLMDSTTDRGESYDLEFRYKHKIDNQYHWFYIKAHPHASTEPGILKILYTTGIVMDITSKKEAEIEMKKIHQQLLSVSRQAGMAEVASSMLHNIGNILNSINVSLAVILETLKLTHSHRLINVAALLKKNQNENYLMADPKGRLIPDYLIALAQSINSEHTQMLEEIENISRHFHHIVDIVGIQKDLTGITGIQEKLVLHEIIDLAIQMSRTKSKPSFPIKIIKKYEFMEEIMTEKVKLLQILVNLINNAKDSFLNKSDDEPKQIIITLKKITTTKQIEITIADNGVGIDPKLLTRIFSLGFTTKPQGHGFGLHSSAINAEQLGGVLAAYSSGPGQGARFTLKIPLTTGFTTHHLPVENNHD